MSTPSSFEQNPASLAEYVCGAAFRVFRGATELGSSFASGPLRQMPEASGRRHQSRIEAVRRAVRTIVCARDAHRAQVRRRAAPHDCFGRHHGCPDKLGNYAETAHINDCEPKHRSTR